MVVVVVTPGAPVVFDAISTAIRKYSLLLLESIELSKLSVYDVFSATVIETPNFLMASRNSKIALAGMRSTSFLTSSCVRLHLMKMLKSHFQKPPFLLQSRLYLRSYWCWTYVEHMYNQAYRHMSENICDPS